MRMQEQLQTLFPMALRKAQTKPALEPTKTTKKDGERDDQRDENGEMKNADAKSWGYRRVLSV